VRVLSLCSGVGGLDLGLERAGHVPVGFCEVDKRCRSVLRRHWPDIPIDDDITTVDGKAWRGRVDLVAGGTPCQDLSVAGRRAGLDGERSGLFWHFCRIADQSDAAWVLWENVAGSLSSNRGEDFAAVLWGLTGFRPAVPANGWRKSGVCVGVHRTVVWRMFDARWFGVPQRRRRVFVVAGPRDVCGPEILLESESLSGDSHPGGATQQEVAGTLGGGSGNRGWAPDTDRMTFIPARVTVAFDSTWSGAYGMSTDDVSPPVKVGSGLGIASPPAVHIEDVGVRRLTPTECERLMGWPDGWTRWADDGTEIADSQRYKMCGNGVVSNVTEWIGKRLP